MFENKTLNNEYKFDKNFLRRYSLVKGFKFRYGIINTFYGPTFMHTTNNNKQHQKWKKLELNQSHGKYADNSWIDYILRNRVYT